jgi:DNA-directed RNA polymerase specialized sigma24 family protein
VKREFFGRYQRSGVELGKVVAMSRKGNYDGGNLRRTLPESVEENNATALLQVLDNNVEELLWIAVVMAGSGQAGEQSLAEAMELAEAAPYVGRGWMLSWIKRLLVHVALRQISGEIRELMPSAGPRSAATRASAGVTALDRQSLRSIRSQWIIASFDVLERACFILHTYLEYPVLDCALLLGCPRGCIEPISERVLTGIVVSGSSGCLNHLLYDEGVRSRIEPRDLLTAIYRPNRVNAASRPG